MGKSVSVSMHVGGRLLTRPLPSSGFLKLIHLDRLTKTRSGENVLSHWPKRVSLDPVYECKHILTDEQDKSSSLQMSFSLP